MHGLLTGAVQARAATDPLSAALIACRALGLRRIGLLSPYIPPVAGPFRAAFQAGGIAVPETLSFGEAEEARAARIAPASIARAASALAGRGGIDGVFLSCTNLRTLGIIAPLEAALGLPVLSSNLVLGWHMAQLSGAPLAPGITCRLARTR
ncbi:aspartate/glutamate racemase family protein [Poseidonocella sp. HB161398]|uniref:aspartate racemase/maleate isomerase family protein n=1 Tax=Poseidonocella sp. HB161398 TaxID=2320855 RepID=UPI0035169010